MRFFRDSSIRSILTYIAILSILPAFATLVYTGIDRRQQTIDITTQQVSLIVRSMAEQQKEITQSTKRVMSIISELPDVKNLNINNINNIFSTFIEQNPSHTNMVLIALDGNVIASATGQTGVNLSDRKHFKDALNSKRFAVGEYIISRMGAGKAVFPFAIPILDDDGNPLAILATILKLNDFANYLEPSSVPEGSFLAVTDHEGIRLYYYPELHDTNPIGGRIRAKNWEVVCKKNTNGKFVSQGSDGNSRFFAYEPVSLNLGEDPYMYVWAGIPEKLIHTPANTAMWKSLLSLSLALLIALLVINTIGRKIIISPLFNLIQLTERLSKGDLDARNDEHSMVREFNTLSHEFNRMAENLQNTNDKISQQSLIDGLTKVANRRGLDKNLDAEWHRALRVKQPISLLMIDIDYFKKFNDTYGHLSGDDCLRSIGLILKSICHRVTDFPARYGGEEFIIIIPETDHQGAFAVAEMIHTQISERQIFHKTSKTSQFLTVSIGLVTLTRAESIQSPIDLIKVADEQLYKAKHEGRNRTSGIEIP